MRHLIDAYAPAEMAQRVLKVGVAKARLPMADSLILAVMAGAFIGLGAAFATLTTTGSPMGLGPTRVMGGVAFSLGLILVVVAGAELFTGNNLVAMAWASRQITTRQVARKAPSQNPPGNPRRAVPRSLIPHPVPLVVPVTVLTQHLIQPSPQIQQRGPGGTQGLETGLHHPEEPPRMAAPLETVWRRQPGSPISLPAEG